MGKKSKNRRERTSAAGSARKTLPVEETARAIKLSIWPAVRRGRVLIVGGLALVLLLGAITPFVYFQGGDNAEYIMLARALVNGQGYTSIYTHPPEPHTKYPFLFPLLIAGIFWMFGEKIVLVKILIAILAAVTVGAAYRLWEEREEPWLALLAAFLVATVPFTLSYSARVLSEIPFAGFATLALLFGERALKRDSVKNPSLALAAVFLLLAFFTRSIGVALAPALVGAFLLKSPRRGKWKTNLVQSGVLALVFLLAAGAWFVRGYLVTDGHGQSYLAEFFIQDPYDLNSPLIGWTDLIRRFQVNGVYYLEQSALTLWPLTSSFDRTHLRLAGVMLGFLSLLGWGAEVRQRRGAPELFAVFYSGLLLSWGFYENRFLIPLFPLLLYYQLKGVKLLVAFVLRLRPSPQNPKFTLAAVGIMSLFLLSFNLWADRAVLQKAAQVRRLQGFELRPGLPIIATNEGMSRFLRLSLYLREHAEPKTVIFTRKPSLVALVTERPAVGGPFTDDPAGFITVLEKNQVTYLICDEVYKEVPKYFLPALQRYPERFQLIYQLPDTQSRIYRFLPPAHPL